MRKAFDSINHEILVAKLGKHGVRGNCSLFESFLKEQRQFDRVNDVLQDFLYLLAGVPQGSILEILLILKYINDLPSASEFSNSNFFSEDTNPIYRKSQVDLFLLNKMFEIVPKRLSVNKFSLYIDRTQAITFLKNQGEEFHLSDSSIALSNCVKSLGFLNDSHLILSFHIAEVVKRLSKHYSVISRFSHYVRKPVLLQYYITYIKPLVGCGLLALGCALGNRLTLFF